MTVFASDAYHDVRFGLYEPTLAFAGRDWAAQVFASWAAGHESILAALHQVGRPQMAMVELSAEDSWALYALSRLADLLVLPLQPPSTDADDDWLPAQAYEQFVAGIGGGWPHLEGFHPFFHEIVAVERADDPATPPQLVAQWWPGCLIDSLLLMRAGVTVRAGADHLEPVVAATSALYWASRRRYRPACDLSHGWGHNSRWRTAFRRDYRLPDRLLYNADAALNAQRDPGDRPRGRELELLRYRCSTLTDHGDDEWVWDSFHVEALPQLER